MDAKRWPFGVGPGGAAGGRESGGLWISEEDGVWEEWRESAVERSSMC